MPAAVTQHDGGTAVVYIAYGPYGIEPLSRFLESYRHHQAGAAHDLIIVWKDWDAKRQASLHGLFEGLPCKEMTVPDGGFDLGSYREVARATHYARYCFLNTNSALSAPNWLAKLSTGLERSGVMAAGATASYQSLATDMLRRIGMRKTWRAPAIMKRHLIHLHLRRLYPPFPNPHLRTNGFLIRREDFLALAMPRLRTKQDATRFESGWRGMTRQLCAGGGTIVAVDAAGRALDVVAWSGSRMFWQDDQQSLLITDNQTRRYDMADAAERETLSRYAWTPLGR